MGWSLLAQTLAIVLASACAQAPRGGSGMPAAGHVRVGLEVDVARVELKALRPVVVEGTDRALEVAAGSTLRVRASGREVRVEVGASAVQAARVTMDCAGEDPCWQLEPNVYTGDMSVHVADSGVTLVNHVDIETYLRGVVPWEIGRPQDALEAVKAQAIAARTYTYSHLGHWEELGFDVYDDVNDQVYRGLYGVHPLTDRAVSETRGLVVRYQGELIRAYYSSTCGGHTSRLLDVWPWREMAPYLQGGRDAPAFDEPSWCRASSHFRWSTGWTARELGDIVRETLPAEYQGAITADDMGRLDGLQVVERDRSGRVMRLEVVTDRARFDVEGDRIRWVLRPVGELTTILRSTMFDVENVRQDGRLVAVRVSGGGFGHGVGMCQSGALGMARAGYDAGEILLHYYKGAQVENAAPGRLP